MDNPFRSAVRDAAQTLIVNLWLAGLPYNTWAQSEKYISAVILAFNGAREPGGLIGLSGCTQWSEKGQKVAHADFTLVENRDESGV